MTAYVKFAISREEVSGAILWVNLLTNCFEFLYYWNPIKIDLSIFKPDNSFESKNFFNFIKAL